MEVSLIDPRDTKWEVTYPTYRVTFWLQQRRNQHASEWASEEWSIKDADIDQVLAWAQDKAQTRPFIIYAYIAASDGPGLIRLFGTDPTAETT
jgi:hypothetical protein